MGSCTRCSTRRIRLNPSSPSSRSPPLTPLTLCRSQASRLAQGCSQDLELGQHKFRNHKGDFVWGSTSLAPPMATPLVQPLYGCPPFLGSCCFRIGALQWQFIVASRAWSSHSPKSSRRHRIQADPPTPTEPTILQTKQY